MFKNRQEFEEALAKSVEAMAKELKKAARNIGGPANDASGKTTLRIAWANKAKKLESEVDRLSSLAEGKPENHVVHATLKRAKKELDDHYDNQPQ